MKNNVKLLKNVFISFLFFILFFIYKIILFDNPNKLRTECSKMENINCQLLKNVMKNTLKEGIHTIAEDFLYFL